MNENFYKYDFNRQCWVIRSLTYMCPDCKRTVEQPVIGIYQVNRDCLCQFPHHVNQMIQINI